MALLSMGVLYFIVLQLEAVSQYQKEALQGGGRDSLVQAREALLGYAATYRDDPLHSTEVFGYLPCPDTDGDGDAEASCGTAGEASVGLLPYKKLGLPDLRDSTGGCLWYAVSGNFKNSPKGITAAVPVPMNWDTQGQFRVRDASGATLVAPDDAQGGAAAVVFAAGSPVVGQNRSASATEPCRIDPSQVAAYLDGSYNFASSAAVIALIQGPVKDGSGSVTNNDRMAWVTPREIFDRVVKRQDFSNPLTASPAGQINKLTDEIKAVLEKKIQDDLVNNTTSNSQPASTGSFTQFTGKQVGLPTTMTLNATYANYYDNWSAGYRQAVCSTLNTPCLTVAGTACRGALMFGGRGNGGQPRTLAEHNPSTANLDAYFEAGSGREILNSVATTFAGSTTYSEISPACAQPAACTEAEKAARRSLDVGTCLFPGEFKSFAQDIAAFAAGVTYSGTQSASVDSGAKTVTLGNTIGGGAGSGCVWHATPLALSTSMRLYFRLQFATKGDGFTLALADGATNLAPNYGPRSQIMCGAPDANSLGYSGPPTLTGTTPGIQKPKLGIEFDTLYSASRNDPPGDHMAFIYWGTTTDTDGSDDNTHYLGNGGVAVTSASWAAGTATLLTPSPHGFAVGQVVLVSGLIPAAYNGTVTITAVPTTTQFSYALTSNPGASTVGGQAKAASTGNAPRNPRVATATRNAPVNVLASDTDPDTGITRTTSWSSSFQRISIVTDVPHGLSAGDQVVVSGIDPPSYNGTYKVLSSGLSTTRPYRFRYSIASDPGTYVSGGTANKVIGAELSNLAWALLGPATADTSASHGFANGQNITTFGMTPNAYGTTANLTLVNATQFTYPLADPGGSFSTETPAGMAMVKSTDAHLPYTAGYRFGFPTATTIYVRLDLNRRYDSTNHVAVLDMKAYVGDSFPLADACTPALMQDLSRDLSALCPSRGVTLQQDSIPIKALATVSSAAWSSGVVTVTTATAHGLVSGASVTISGASPTAYNGTFPITVTGANTFTYAAATSPGTYVSGGDIEPLSTFYFGFTNGRGSSNAGENQSITIYNLLMRSQ
jgi:hypothetical protein